MNRDNAKNSLIVGNKPRPLTVAIRALMAGGLVAGHTVRAELPAALDSAALASHGKAEATVDAGKMTIHQTTDKATLEWASFNVGKDNQVVFDQPNASSVALNNIHQSDPSRIFGQITANGQIYLVNQNGFIFGKDSQVNANALVASTLGISQDVFERGITKVFDINNAAALQGNGEVFLKDQNGAYLRDQNGDKIKIQILLESGAKIHSDKGGRVVLAAPVIDQQGSIETPDGQTILAAAKDKVYLQESGDSDTRGLLVEVATGGEINNVGKVLAERGDASLIGFAIHQNGHVSATTSVNLNGTVHLMAREGIQDPTSTGGKLQGKSTTRQLAQEEGLGTKASVTLGAGSLTSVDLDADKQAAAIDAQQQPQSKIHISGHDVVLQSQATVRAPSGDVELSAMDNPADPLAKGDARVFLASDSTIDVAGVKNVSLAMDRNVVEVELRKNELRDAPEQRNGVLYGQKVKVDLREADLAYDGASGKLVSASIPIADIKGSVDRIARNIDERSTEGGSINLKSSGDVVTQKDSTLDFSGGSIAYRAGVVTTTQLLAKGQVVDIAHADPNRHYDGIKLASRSESGYVEGKAGGQLHIQSYQAALNGALKGQVVAGPYQRPAGEGPKASSVEIDLSRGNQLSHQGIAFTGNQSADLALNDPIPRANPGTQSPRALELAADLFKNAGVGQVNLKTNGQFRVDAAQKVELPSFGKLSVETAGADIQGQLVARAGKVDIRPVTAAGVLAKTPITLGSNAQIDVSGLWVNDWLEANQGRPIKGPIAINGGSVTLTSEGADLALTAGSRIDASGGGWLQASGGLHEGHGGAISLTAATQAPGRPVAHLLLDGQLSAWGLSAGGTLNLASNEILIAADDVAGSGQPLHLNAGFFQQGGFANYSLTANAGGLTVANGTALQPLQRNRSLNPDARDSASGSHLADISEAYTLPDVQRAPVSLTLAVQGSQTQKRDAMLRIEQGASITTDPEATVSLSSDSSIQIDGSIKAPAGRIEATIHSPTSGDTGYYASQGIWLGAESVLSTAGTFKPVFNNMGLALGEVLDGGEILLSANRGAIVTQNGSLLDASGTRHSVEYQANAAADQRQLSSQGGRIALTAAESIVAEGAFNLHGGKGAAGGELSIELNSGLRNKPDVPVARGAFPDDADPAKPRSIEISQNGSSWLNGSSNGPFPLASQLNGRALLSADLLNNAGASQLSFKVDPTAANRFIGSILFDGDVNLTAQRSIRLDAPVLKTSGGASVTLNADYIALGSSNGRLDTPQAQGTYRSVLAPDAVTGSGSFTVSANAIDLIGGLSFNGFNNAVLNSQGDVRAVGIRTSRETKDFLGELKLAGDLTIHAAQIYPSTLTHYTFNVGTAGGNQTVTLLRSNQQTTPVLSAAGSLTINAPNIVQKGVLKAPFGELNLHASQQLQLAAGSLTSISGDGQIVPFGQVSGGLNWLYPLDAAGVTNILLKTPPEKRLNLTGNQVELSQGAVVDLSGGGDLYAYEFIPGPGGSKDVLDANSSGFQPKFAVMPSLGHGLTPIDPLEFGHSGLTVGDSVYLGGGSGLAAGWYTLLPAHYALLPGAYLITPVADSSSIQPGVSYTDYRGATIVAGRYGVASAGIADSHWQGFTVENGSIARSRSEYKDYSANKFFADTVAAQLPQDAGALSIDVVKSLGLHAELRAAAANNGRGGEVDISAERLAIVGRREDAVDANGQTTVVLLDDDLNALNAPSLLLGGIRHENSNGRRVSISTKDLSVSGDSHLQGEEIILAAQNQLKIQSGAEVISSGQSSLKSNTLAVSNVSGGSDGVLVRVSGNRQGEVLRDQTVSGQQGVLTVEQGARLAAEGSMLLDSTRNTVFNGQIDMQGGSLALKSSRISIGDAPTGTSGLVLRDPSFNLDELILSSASDLDLYGAVQLDSHYLTIEAAQINGFNNAGQIATLKADTLQWSNPGTSSAPHSASGSGTLLIETDNLALGSGNYAVEGFKNVDMQAKQTLKGLGQSFNAQTGDSSLSAPGRLLVDADLKITAGHITGGNGATTTIDTGDHAIELQTFGSVDSQWRQGLGVSWSLAAGSIGGSARFDLPSGVLNLHALKGDVTLNAGSDLAMAGGSLSLIADSKNVSLDAGATVDLAAKEGDAGSLRVIAPEGHFDWQGTINAQAGTKGKAGRLQLELAELNGETLSDLNSKRHGAGFDEVFALNIHKGDLKVGKNETILAHHLQLSTLRGSVAIAGALDTQSESGSINLYGHDGISLAETGSIHAGDGQVLLDTVHGDDAGSGLLDLSATGGKIDVAGTQGKGQVHLRTGRDAQNTVAVSAINTKITGADPSRIALEATRVYQNVPLINQQTIAGWKADTQQFMDTVGQSGLNWLPGLEIRSSGNLTLQNNWDLLGWRYQDRQGATSLPGFLTLKAADKLRVNASLSDGLASGSLPGDSRVYQDMIQAGGSWSYNLIAGGNIELAASNANSQVVVRTGTGNINLQAGGDIRFVADSKNASNAAAVYTVGTVVQYTRSQLLQGLVPGVPARLNGESDTAYLNRLDPRLLNDLLRFGYLDESRIGQLYQKAEFPTHGGDIALTARGNIDGINTGQKMTDWLVRSGTLADNKPTLWGINISGDRSNPSGKGNRFFNQNVGALGGGNLNIAAEGSIRNLSAMMPTTGKPFGTFGSSTSLWTANRAMINGGGDLTLSAGNDIVGGEYYVGLGKADIKAGGSIGAGTSGSIFELADADVSVSARQDIGIAGVYNPTVLKQTRPVGGESRFFSYGADSAVHFESLAGNINFKNNVADGFEYSVYPATLTAKALSGDISIDKSMTLIPDAKGQLSLFANNNIRSSAVAGQTVSINMSDADPNLLPHAANAAASLEGSLNDGLIRARERLDPTIQQTNIIHAAQPVHLGDNQKVSITAKQGNIAFASGSNVTFYLPKAAEFVAGQDIRNLSVTAQNLQPNDVTRVQAGRDIIFDTQISNNGVVLANDNAVKLGGSGRLEVLAGRDVNLGSSDGILTMGNLVNTALGDGAGIEVLTGLNGKLDLQGFIEKYADKPDYRQLLSDPDSPLIRSKVLQVLFKEIQASATAAAAAPEDQRFALYERGFDAIKALFPDAKYQGNLSLVFSQIKTLDGGDITLAVPGGNVDVGLAGKQGGISKSADALGIVVQQQGNLNALVNGNFNVNQSRVFTLAGGDLTVWSSDGSIDAGKGAKSAIAAPPPKTTVDEKGNIVTVFPPIVSGSGIQAVGKGLVTLAAPKGIVDAGEAGISGGQVVIAATAVVGASNISASGGTVGVPSSVAPTVSVAGADNAAAGAAKSATQLAGSDNANNDAAKDAAAKALASLNILTSDVVGYGDCSEADVRDGKQGCGG